MNIFLEVTPSRIEAIDQRQFPRTRPVLDVFLSLNRKQHRRMSLEINERLNAVALGKFAQATLVFAKPLRDIVCHADIKRAAWFACKNVKPCTLHRRSMDCRVKPGNDEVIFSPRYAPSIFRNASTRSG